LSKATCNKNIPENEFKEIQKFPQLKSLNAGKIIPYRNRKCLPLRYTVLYIKNPSELKSVFEYTDIFIRKTGDK